MSLHLSGAETILSKAVDDMDKRFASTSTAWRDKARNDFEAEHLDELKESIKKAQHSMRNIEELLRRVVKECS